MKLYIIFTLDIHPIGGMQLYTAGKADYLKRNGWEVVVFYPGSNDENCAVTSLNRYVEGGNLLLDYRPAQLPKNLLKGVCQQMKKCLPEGYTQAECIYVETQSDVTALWGELLAKRIGARHICFNCNELFRGVKKYYEENIEFFKFKYARRELLGLHTDTLQKIFDGYMTVPCDSEFLFDAVEPGPIQDVNSEFVNQLPKYDWTIVYIGRAEKRYVENIIEGVSEFAQLHSDKEIQFIMVGNADCRRNLIAEKLDKFSNLHVELAGDMVPIPKSLYKKTDVVIAGAVCAEISARESVPTIVADCENYLSCGVLGYTTMNSMYHEEGYKQTGFGEALEDVLVNKTYLQHRYAFPEAISPDQIFESHFSFFDGAEKKKEYYDVEDRNDIKKIGLTESAKAFLKLYNPKLFFDMYEIKKRFHL